jgi:FMN phosphatase YigB (HAD superfamily)
MICLSHQVSLLPSQAIEAVFFDLDATLVSSTLNFQQIRQELGYEGEVDFFAINTTFAA